MARKSNSPNDKPRPQSRRKATLNSRNAPRKSATAPFDPARFPDLKEMHSDEIGVGYVIGVARSPKSTAPFDPARFPDLKEMHSDEIGVGYVIGVARSPKSGTD